jgi:hypothetical protein
MSGRYPEAHARQQAPCTCPRLGCDAYDAAIVFPPADIDSPRGGVIRVTPLNLHALAESMRAH